MRIKRSRFDPFDIDRERTYRDFTENEVRCRVWRNENWKGSNKKFDLVHVKSHGNYEEYCQGIPLELAHDAFLAMQKFADWLWDLRYDPPTRKPLTDLEREILEKSNRKR